MSSSKLQAKNETNLLGVSKMFRLLPSNLQGPRLKANKSVIMTGHHDMSIITMYTVTQNDIVLYIK